MPSDDPQDRKTRIEHLKRKIEAVTGEKVVSMNSDESSPELQEKFWENVLAFEQAPGFKLFDTLVNGGLDLPSANDLDDVQLSKKLWEVIRGLSLLGTFLYNTDHLSDRELYDLLWDDILREEGIMQPVNTDSACHIDIIGAGSEQDIFIFLKYYADEAQRKEWARDFSEEDFPAHERKPYDRDSHLPRREEWGEGQC